MRLNLKLREGFRDDAVSISVDGRPVATRAGVTTDLSVSFADAIDIDLADDAVVELGVAVAGGPTASTRVHVADTPFVECWRLDGRIELRKAKVETPIL